MPETVVSLGWIGLCEEPPRWLLSPPCMDDRRNHLGLVLSIGCSPISILVRLYQVAEAIIANVIVGIYKMKEVTGEMSIMLYSTLRWM